MKKITATLIAGLFATAAFAQTTTAPAPTKAEVKADAKEAKADLKADTKDARETLKADTKDAKAAAQADGKTPVKSSVKPPAEVSTTTHTGTAGATHGADVSATARTK